MEFRGDIYSEVGSDLLTTVKSRVFDDPKGSDSVGNCTTSICPEGMGCQACCKTFDFYAKWRLHYKSRLHAENLKRKLRGKQPLAEVNEDGSSSSDESATSSDEMEESEAEQSTTEPNIANLNADEFKELKFSNEEFFVTQKNEVVSIKRCLLPLAKVDDSPSDLTLEFVQRLTDRSNMVVLMLSSGRFAGCVFSRSTPVVHKTFVRYTVRAKQGGGQSGRDSQQGGSHPKSAGAALRRYNERALAEDIGKLLTSWQEHLKVADYIFLRCAKPNRRLFFDANLLNKSDPRLRTIPFTTYKPTFEEVCRVHKNVIVVNNYGELSEFRKLFEPNKPLEETTSTRTTCEPIEISRVTDEPTNQGERKKTRRKGKTSKVKSEAKSSTVVENVAVEEDTNEPLLEESLRRQIFTACRAGDAEAMRNVYDSNVAGAKEDVQMAFLRYLNSPVTSDSSSPTLLHLAVFNNHKSLVRLLLELGADPTVRTSGQQFKQAGQVVSYQLCPERPLRQVFVEFRRDNADLWDWKVTQIPEPPGVEEEQKRQEKVAERRRKEREGKKKRERERKEVERTAEAERSERERFLALSDREKRALAAERRILAQCNSAGGDIPVLKRCCQCAVDLSGKVPFEYGNNVFCSMACLKIHRSKPG